MVQRDEYRGERLARPHRILVYDFGSTPDQVPPESAIASQITLPTEPPSEDELEVARELGESVSTELTKDIVDMGLPAFRAATQPPAKPGDLVIKGYFLTVDEGSTFKRVVIGFGAGSAELKTFVEGYQMTEYGLRRLGSGEIESGSFGGTPGMVIPIATTIITANPIGLVVGGAVKVGQEIAGTTKIQASGKRTADLIAEELRPKFEEQGWIEAD